ncbi:hypothetical protein ACQY0O_004402 [Thecaphora frezii]
MATNLPAFSFNPDLHLRTIDPPVSIGAEWARSFPSQLSPFHEARDLEADPLLNLAQGVPGQPPTRQFLERLIKETLAPYAHGYGPGFGDDALRQAVADYTNHFYRSKDERGQRNAVKGENVGITAGCNMAFASTVMSLAARGDGVVIPTPWYFNHFMTLTQLGIDAIALPTRAPDFVPSADRLRKLLASNSRIKAVVLITPNNPTGAMYPPSLVHEFARICRDAKIALLLDETYRDFVLSEEEAIPPIGSAVDAKGTVADASTPSASLTTGRPHRLFFESLDGESSWDWRQTVIQLFSFSKSYAIPGHRLGGVVAHSAFLKQHAKDAEGAGSIVTFGPMAKALDNLQISPPRIDTQRTVAWAMSDPAEVGWRLDTARKLRDRRVEFVEGLRRKVPRRLAADESWLAAGSPADLSAARSPREWGWSAAGGGGYYVFLRHPFDDTPSEKVAEALAKLVGVVLLPGSFFMPPGSPCTEKDAAAAASCPEDANDSGAWLRVSIGNAPIDRLRGLPERLALFSELWHAKGHGWGV